MGTTARGNGTRIAGQGTARRPRRARLAARRGLDLAYDGAARAWGLERRIDRLAERAPASDVLVLGIYQADSLIREAVEALRGRHHRVRFALGSLGEAPLPELEPITLASAMRGNKFENVNELLSRLPEDALNSRWTLLLDDDVAFPARFLERFLALCEHFDLQLAQPAMTRRSHASWRVTRRRPLSLVRETRFVEGGQLTAFREEAAAELLPFPADAQMWGLDLHWAAVAVERGWRMGVVDGIPVRHESRSTGQTYSLEVAHSRGGDFVRVHRALTPQDADRTVAVHRTLHG